MAEYGVFEDGLCIEDGFNARTAAQLVADEMKNQEPDCDYTVEEICPDHPEQPKATCEACAEEDSEDGNTPRTVTVRCDVDEATARLLSVHSAFLAYCEDMDRWT